MPPNMEPGVATATTTTCCGQRGKEGRLLPEEAQHSGMWQDAWSLQRCEDRREPGWL